MMAAGFFRRSGAYDMHWWRKYLWFQRLSGMRLGIGEMLLGCFIFGLSLYRLVWPQANAQPAGDHVAGMGAGVFFVWWGWRTFRAWKATEY